MSPLSSDNPARLSNLMAMIALLLSLAMVAMNAMRGYGIDQGHLGERVTAVETNQTNLKERLERIENKIDIIYDKLAKLIP